ncbi:ATP-grasp domain-containing protein [Pseudooceanicola sediminis]|uniref:ATP-grasp domain-containing protein n=1 Tax=Pseudooceanicola sediminis TaxID=2211117 RepID=A0A399J387_9RHOB|nr:biotin carboxylase N-terminal domain-containing protein [Pseudooceanicola sediminis]KAA2316184.1 ATP-grasp domain-containing protein [Puniceibacterium sp. HSS470]RII39097.1 ATP-grasp domain-containing protein [Pseudooceanicola sediminis]|tara:strand:+ start:82965 stop:84932 length:1968 start_codon:yes stop_codon:yes gene_type:complete
MFDTILIANRGEIACRVIESARAMGLRTVAVHSDPDAGARHVALADVAVSIGGASPAESYLRGDAIIAAAQATGAQAIHPGYGFLSENPDFVEAVEAAGLVFIGPSARAIRAMGLKDAAKALMAEAGVPVVPGYQGAEQGAEHLAARADEVGYPVLIKAVAGGGGKGMRLVETPEAFAEALTSAQAEAQGAFGNPVVLIEKFVASPRHIEVQVFGDGTRAVHLFERDCSLQRRHQKVIEEAPAPGMTQAMRRAMGDAAVRAAEAIGYSGAGTVEFIVDGSDGLRADRFWFMEMNTRLQVEHPVTEAVTGVDLVAWQIRVAAGEPLPVQQGDLALTGHAFEARLYAEDVAKGFLPATGRLAHLRFADGARADTGVRAGDVISPHYDPMIAKIITHGATREIALRKLARALRETEVAGTVTNLGFLGALAEHAGFGRGEVDTGLIGREVDALCAAPVPGTSDIAWAALVALGLTGVPGAKSGFTLWSPLRRTVILRTGDEELRVSVTSDGAAHDVQVGETVVQARFDAEWRLDGMRAPGWHRAGDRITLFTGHGQVFDLVDPLQADAQSTGGGDVILAPMPGLVRAIVASAGQVVAAGQRLAILEAMKMEHALIAPRDGTVAELLAVEGAQVEAGAALIRLESEPGAQEAGDTGAAS